MIYNLLISVLLVVISGWMMTTDRWFGYDAPTPVAYDVAAPAPLTVPTALAAPTNLSDRRTSVEVLDVVGW